VRANADADQLLAEKAAKAIAAARTKLVLGRRPQDAFFATLALRLQIESSWDCPTAATDGKRLIYNPNWFADLSAEEAQGVVAHEVMHCALAHHARRHGRDPTCWNIAADLSVNPLLLDAGFRLPSGRLVPGEGTYRELPQGQSAEEYYALLPRGQPCEQEGKGRPGGDPGSCGVVLEPRGGSPAETRRAEAEWKVAVIQAQEIARQRGSLSGGLARMVQQILRPQVDWRDVLREFVAQHARNDYAWAPPNRRFIHAGLYLPGLRSEELGHVVLAVDTSGSIGRDELDRFAAETQAILDAYDCTLTIMYHDSRVQRVETWRAADGPLTLHPIGGGGTDHRPVFEHIEREGIDATCAICLTDLESSFPAIAPAYPVLWAVVGNRRQPPFGTYVTLSERTDRC
jgi:predicted metal-dependent peptidase